MAEVPIFSHPLLDRQFAEDRGFARDPSPQRELSFGEMLEGAYVVQSPIYNSIIMGAISRIPEDPNFDLKRIKDSPYFEGNEDYYLDIKSEAQLMAMDDEMARRKEARRLARGTGVPGLLAEVAAGLASPTTLMPFMGPSRGIVGVAESMGLAALAIGIDEAVLHAAQPERTTAESAGAIITGAAFVGALGGLMKFLSPADKAIIERSIDEGIDRVSIQASGTPTVGGGSVGAQRVGRGTEVGELRDAEGKPRRMTVVTGIKGLDKVTDFDNPVARQLNNEYSTEAQHAMSQMANDSAENVLSREGRAMASGGSVEMRVRSYDAYKARAIEIVEGAFRELTLGPNAGGPFKGIRAAVIGRRSDFYVELTRAMFNNDKVFNADPARAAQNKIVENAAKQLRTEVLDPVFNRAVEVGYLSEESSRVLGDASYLSRLWDVWKINRDPLKFRTRLADHFEAKFDEEYTRRLANLEKAMAERQLEIQDINLTGAEAAQRMQKVRQDFAVWFNENRKLYDTDEEIKFLRKIEKEFTPTAEQRAQRAARNRQTGSGAPAEDFSLLTAEDLRNIREERLALERQNREGLQNFRKVRASVRRRLRNLARTVDGLTLKQNRVRERIDHMTDQNINAIIRLHNRVNTLQRQADRFSDEVFEEKLSKLQRLIAQTEGVLERGEARMEKAAKEADLADEVGLDSTESITRWYNESVRQDVRADLLAKRQERLDDLTSLDREGAIQALEEIADDLSFRLNELNGKRAVRAQKLEEKLAREGLPTEAVKARTKELESSIASMRDRFVKNYSKLGADVDIDARTIYSRDAAERLAEEFYQLIQRNPVRTPGLVLLEERGPALARMLDVKSLDFEEFIETDVERILDRYVRTMGSDIEFYDRFGRPNLAEYLADGGRLDQEMMRRQTEIAARDISEEAKQKLFSQLAKKTQMAKIDLAVVEGRIRGTRGIPENPDGILYRMGRAAMEANVVRLMGKVMISSVQDIARPVMKHGLLNTFKHGFVPLVANMKASKALRGQVLRAGTALDVLIHTRANMLFDVFDDAGRRSAPERVLKFMSDKTGVVAGFNYWNRAMKQFTGTIFISKLLDDIDAAAAGRATKQQLSDLAHYGIDDRNLDAILEQIDLHHTEVNGIKIPEIQNWTNSEAKIAIQAAIVKGVDDTIITPGAARPNWVDNSIWGRLIAQFRAFSLASTRATLYAGLQKRDISVALGGAFSLALGAMSYYLWAVSMGGKIQSDMENASLGKWAEEAIDRSGLLGMFGEVRKALDSVPFVPTVFDDSRLTRQPGDWQRQFFGPTAGIIAEADAIMKSIDEPTVGTLKNIQDLIVPYNNVFYMERVWSAINEELADALNIPEKRTRQQ